MKVATRLEISKTDEKNLMKKVDSVIASNSAPQAVQELITYYRSQLHIVFKMGLKASNMSFTDVD